ncbi:MAG: hypothetical protein ACR2ME_04890 [Acidimicrobiia bacterium]
MKNPVATKKAPVATKSPAPSKEATVRSMAKERGWTLEKVVGGKYRLVDSNGTWLAADWETGDGLSLPAIEAALK